MLLQPKVLFDLITRDKVLPENGGVCSKMAGFALNTDTPAYIKNMGLLTAWWHKLFKKGEVAYRAVIKESMLAIYMLFLANR